MSFRLVYDLLLLQFVLGYPPFEHRSPGLRGLIRSSTPKSLPMISVRASTVAYLHVSCMTSCLMILNVSHRAHCKL